MLKGYLKAQKDLDLEKTLKSSYALLFLEYLFKSRLRKDIILKGESAAFLGYGIGDVVNKIELITLREIIPSEFIAVIDKFRKNYKSFKLEKQTEKRYTTVFEFKITELDEPINLTFETTKIKYNLQRGLNYDIRSIELPYWAYKVVGQVQILSEVIKDNPEYKNYLNMRL